MRSFKMTSDSEGAGMKTKYKSIKVERHKYSVPIPKRRLQISVGTHLCVCNHKGRWVVAFTQGNGFSEYFFEGRNTLNRTQALKMISFLSDYVNLVKPTEATFLNASVRAKTNSVIRDTEALTGLAIKKNKL